MRGFSTFSRLVGLGTAIPAAVLATPANKAALEKHLGPYLPAELDSCAICHVRAEAHGAESLEEFPHNSFGNALHALDGRLQDRLTQLGADDSDTDGVSNLHELLAGSHPGDPGSTRRPAANLPRQFAEFSKRYPWEPFLPVTRPPVPDNSGGGLVIRSPIDAFLAEQHRSRKLTPRPEASRELWLRRVHLDLIGLNPTPAELEAFLADERPGAHERVVARLLEHPGYGERWGRHWMDIWRYSDWAGYKKDLRESQRHIWHWRDWIVESLNEDKPYSRMILEMLAGDELAPEDDRLMRATGFLARQYFRNRDQWLDNVVTHTSQAFLGITMGCAKCHDHMYDPFPQQDYYAMRAIFEPYQVRTDRVPGVLDRMEGGIPRAYDASVDAKTYLFERGDERRPLKENPIPPAVPAALGGAFAIDPITLPPLAYQPDRRAFVKRDLMHQARQTLDAARANLEVQAAQQKVAALEAIFAVEDLEMAGRQKTPLFEEAARKALRLQREQKLAEARWKIASATEAQTKARSAMDQAREKQDKSAEARASKSLSTAKKDLTAATKLLTEAEKAMKQEVNAQFEPRPQATFPNRSSGRRLAFARWLTHSSNPLTARVAMNHIWLRHFGQAIVPTVTEFGANGREPTHPALLDWLAAEFMASGWSMKHMHQLICTSSVYRLSGTYDPVNRAIDPDNHYLWHMPSRRMEGEVVRDNLLWIPGRLDPTLGGPDIDHLEAQTSRRRSIYLRHAHEKLVEFVRIFDGPKVSECYQREESVQPHQALALANSRLTYEAARKLEGELPVEPSPFVDAAFRAILSRLPHPEEQRECLVFLESAQENGRRRLISILFNHNEFVTIR